MATSLAVPLAYITVLVTGMAIFSRVYRKRKAAEVKSWEPWFPTHPARDIYISLVSASASTSSSSTPPLASNEKDKSQPSNKIPLSMLKSSLLVRATADVKRIWRIRDDKMALANLHNRGLVGDDTMARFAAAEKELEAEILDVVQEANTFRQGWGGMIFQTATEMAHAERTREVVLNIPKVKALEDKQQERRKKYLPTPTPNSSSTPAATPSKATPAPSSTSGTATPQDVPAPVVGASPAAAPAAANLNASGGDKSGQSSTTTTPSKNTPSKKKKGKK